MLSVRSRTPQGEGRGSRPGGGTQRERERGRERERERGRERERERGRKRGRDASILLSPFSLLPPPIFLSLSLSFLERSKQAMRPLKKTKITVK